MPPAKEDFFYIISFFYYNFKHFFALKYYLLLNDVVKTSGMKSVILIKNDVFYIEIDLILVYNRIISSLAANYKTDYILG